jgi:uncharacterized protein (TIGR00730 family)
MRDDLKPMNRVKKAPKAYDNREFIHSRDGRTVRILAEYLYPDQHFRKRNINKAIIFFGSARSYSKMQHKAEEESLNRLIKEAIGADKKVIEAKIEALKLKQEVTEYYEDARKLSQMFCQWSKKLKKDQKFYICSGGGPGIMEAANRGAYECGEPNIGLNISLPFEQEPNQYISPDLNFEFHYFFMRKLWFVDIASAFIVFPGGFGTMDELFEILTLQQTLKVQRPIPIILYSEKFWKNLINFELMVQLGTIKREDLNLFKYANNIDDAFNYITKELTHIYKLK